MYLIVKRVPDRSRKRMTLQKVYAKMELLKYGQFFFGYTDYFRKKRKEGKQG